MRVRHLPSLLPMALLAACGSTVSLGGPAVPLRYNTEVEYVEVGRLVAATENALSPLGPGRSYWYDAADDSRWASEMATVPATTKVVIFYEGLGYVDPSRREFTLRHVEGPRNVKRGWYGRLIEIEPGAGQALHVTLEDGRRFEVTGETREDLPRLPFEVLLGEDLENIFVLEGGDVLEVVRTLEP